MLRPRLFRPSGKIKAQALVEFTLTAMWLILTLMLIVEVARIFQTYVTLQSAARAGARYAVTGQWDATYAGDPSTPAGIAKLASGWDPVGSPGAPLKHIPPCWPRFNDVGDDIGYYVAPTSTWPYTLPNVKYAEPYRDPRTCSIEATVIRGLTGIPLDAYNTGEQVINNKQYISGGPTYNIRECCAKTGKPYTYTITVSGYTTAVYPKSGDFGHPDFDNPTTDWIVDDYSSVPQFAGQPDGGGLSPGYGGDPGGIVVVQVDYQFGLITPILSRIVPSMLMRGVATMTNEHFGSTSVQSNAVLPPPPISIPARTDPIPANLVINSIWGPEGFPAGCSATVPCTDSPPPLEDVTFDINVANIGGLDTSGVSKLKLYYIKTPTATEPTLPTPLKPSCFAPAGPCGATFFGEGDINVVAASMVSDSIRVTGQFPLGGDYYLYAVADADDVLEEQGIGLTTFDPAREDDNVFGPSVTAGLHIVVSSVSDLSLKKWVDDVAPANGQTIHYFVSISNGNGAAARNVRLVDDFSGAGAAYILPSNPPTATITVGGSGPAGTYDPATHTWTIPFLGRNQTATLDIPALVTGTTGSTYQNKVGSLQILDTTSYDPFPTNDMGCTPPSPGALDCKTAQIDVGAINLALVKAVTGVPAGGVIENSAGNCTSGPCFAYTLTATNKSTVTSATNVTVVDTLPVGITFASGTGCSVTSGTPATGQTVTCTLGTLATSPLPASVATATINVFANLGTGGQTLVNTARVSATEVDPDQSNNTSTASVAVQSIDIKVVKSVNPLYTPTGVGNNFTWTITVSNIGTNDANNIVIEDVIPATYINATPVTPTLSVGSWSAATNRWTIPTLVAKGAAQTMRFVVSAKTTADGVNVDNVARFISADKTDVNSANNQSTSTARVTNANSADIELSKSVSPNGVGPNTIITYTFTVTNNGPKPATGVFVKDTPLLTAINSGFFAYNGTPSANWNTTTGIWTYPGTVAAGQSQTFTLSLKLVGNAFTPIFVNTATSGSALTDQDLSNNSATTSLTIDWPAIVFVNAGGAGCGLDTWGTSNDPLKFTQITPHKWEPSTIYKKKVSFGFYGSYTLNPPVTGYTFVGYGPVPPAITAPPYNPASSPDGQNLLGCTATGKNFNWRRDSLLPGLYQITLVFADPDNAAGKHRFKVDALTHKSKAVKLLKNFDINYTIEKLLGTGEKYKTGTNVHYYAQTFNFRVKSGGGNYLRLHFYSGTRSLTYKVTTATVSGIGLTYIGP